MFPSKIILLIFLFPLFMNAQINHKDSLEINDQTNPEEYIQRANGSLAAGLIFMGAGVLAIFNKPSPTFIVGGALAIVIGTVAVIHSNYLRSKASRMAMRRAKKKRELSLDY
jgi:hypothetical protein